MATYQGKNFSPFGNYTVNTPGASSTNTVVTQPTNGRVASDLTISNATNQIVFVAWGLTAATATTSSFAVMPGAIMTIDMALASTNIAVIAAATSTGAVYLSIGLGT